MSAAGIGACPAHPTLATRNMRTRPVVETTGRAIELTGSIWEAASALLAA